jgi:hypothetical protein
MESNKPAFWEPRYRSGKIPWDFHGVPMALREFLKSTPRKGRVLIPGCGSAYEVKAFQEHGWEPLGIDFCEAAIEKAKQKLGNLSNQVLLADFFEHDFGSTKFDLIYERTFLCSMPQKLWLRYSTRLTHLLADGGLLAGIFLYGEEKDPPPYPLAQGELCKILGNAFECIEEKTITDSLEVFKGKEERWEVWKKLPN